MASNKQIAANKENAKKSTGPKTEEGKALVAENAVKHGVLSQKLFLPGESPANFADLQDELRLALQPQGMLELTLVEKIAVAMWKQRRLIAAEAASIRLATTPSEINVRSKLGNTLGIPTPSEADLVPFNEDDITQRIWCETVVKERESLHGDLDLKTLEKAAPYCYRQFIEEAETDEETPEDYLASLSQGLYMWVYDLSKWAKEELTKYERREKAQHLLPVVQAKQMAHVGMDLLNRYQAAFDNELYKAMTALQKQQEWRQKNGTELEVEVETE